MDEQKKLKLAIVSGASHALSYKRDHPRASDEDAIQHVTREANVILKKVGEEE